MPKQHPEKHYYAFGSPMASRTVDQQNYRFGFNGKENDNETGTQDYGMRIYDPALGKFLSTDPLSIKFPWYTPYQFAGNAPIRNIDLDGAEPTSKIEDWDVKNAQKYYFPNGNMAYKIDGYWIYETMQDNWAACTQREYYYYDPSDKENYRWRIFTPYSQAQSDKNYVQTMSDFCDYGQVVTVVAIGIPFVLLVAEAGGVGGGIIVASYLVEEGAEEGLSKITGQDVVIINDPGDIIQEGFELGAKKGTKEVIEKYSKATYDSFEKQLKDHGVKSLEKSRKKLMGNIAKETNKIEAAKKAGGYTTSMEREIRTFQSQIDAIDDVIKNQ